MNATAHVDEVDRARPRRPNRRRALVALGVLVVAAVLVWGYVAVSLLLEARERAERGRDALQSLTDADPLDADLEEVRDDLALASVDVAAARERLASPVLAPLRPLPVIGRQLASARALAVTAELVLTTIAPAVERVVEARAAGSEAGERMELLAALDGDLTRVDEVLGDLDLGPDEALIAPLADARYQASVQLADLALSIGDALTVVQGLRAFLEDSSYLILAANPAEMANAGGMFLSVGGLETVDGELDLDEFRHSSELFPVAAQPIDDPDVAARWGHLFPANDFRKLNLSPRFASYAGPQGLEMWEAVTGERPDGAIAVDPMVVQALLEVVGPVEVEGRPYDADTILSYALAGQYEEFDDGVAQEERRELVAAIARAAVNAMGERSWDPLELIRTLRPTAEGRHLLAYSEDPLQQAMWSTIGVDGEVSGDELMVNLAGLGAHKLDPFVSLSVTGGVDAAASRLVLDVEITNATPPGISEFADGVPSAFGAESGTYIGRLAVFTPGTTEGVTVDPGQPLEAAGPDGPLFVTAFRLQIPAGERQTFRFEVDLQDDTPSVEVMPSSRIPPVTWSVDGQTWQDTEARVIQWR